MKKILVLALAALASTGVSRADYSLSTDISFASEYIFRGVKLADNTLHPSLELTQNDFYLGMWAALPINDTRPNDDFPGYGNEFDFYLGYTKELSDKASLDLGATYYYYPSIPRDSDGIELYESTVEAYVGLTFDIAGFTPAAYAYYDFDLENLTLQGSIGYSIPMAGAGTSLDLSATYGMVEPDEGDSYTYYGASAQIPYKLNDNATLTVGVHYASNDIGRGIEDNFLYYTAGITIGF